MATTVSDKLISKKFRSLKLQDQLEPNLTGIFFKHVRKVIYEVFQFHTDMITNMSCHRQLFADLLI